MRNMGILAGAVVAGLLLTMPARADGLREALSHLRQARAALDRAWDNKGGHKKTALSRIDEASNAIQEEMRRSGDRDRDHRRDDDHRRDGDRSRADDHRRDGHRDDDQHRGNRRGDGQ